MFQYLAYPVDRVCPANLASQQSIDTGYRIVLSVCLIA
jgi:hypothetical protein